jgi:hypothetical protein
LRMNSLRSALFSFCSVRLERKQSFILKQTPFSANNCIQWHGNTLTYDLVQCDGFNKWTIAWRWPWKAETCSNWCNFNVILNLWETVNSLKPG